jgi:uncharacterized membrane protein YgdD (TMEM256/DUF423 family)
MYKQALIIGVLLAMLSVILGAFGAHALKQILAADQLLIFETGVRYQFYHSFALILSGILYHAFPHKNIHRATFCFTVGVALFSGSLYAMTLTGITVLGAITPIGGLFFIAGWLFLLATIIKKPA